MTFKICIYFFVCMFVSHYLSNGDSNILGGGNDELATILKELS